MAKKGTIKIIDGVRYKHNGQYWCLDQIIDPIDKLHNYSGRQGKKKPYNRVSAQASLLR